MTDNVL